MIFGFDPSIKVSAYCIYDPLAKRIVRVGVFRSPKGLKGTDAAVSMCTILPLALHSLRRQYSITRAVIEGQNDHAGGKKSVRPIDIMKLALVAGAAVAGMAGIEEIVVPSPSDWKGSIPKQAKQAQILKSLNIDYEKRADPKNGYCVPLDPGEIPGGGAVRYITDWKEIVDATGLAKWGADQCWKKEQHQSLRDRIKARKSRP